MSSQTRKLLESIRLAVTCLYILPLRRPAPLDRITDKSSEEVSSFGEFDLGYVRDKFPDPRLEDSVKKRLGTMITKRRQLLLYRRRHNLRLRPGHGDLLQDKIHRQEQCALKGEIPGLHQDPATRTQPEGSDAAGQTKATTLRMENVRLPHETIDFLTLSVADSNSRTSLAASQATKDIHLEVPPRPHGPDGKPATLFECDYCCLTVHINSYHAWK